MKRIHVTYPAHQHREVSHAIAGVALSRTRHLHREAATRTICDLLIDAYLQGVGDMVETLDKRGLLTFPAQPTDR